MSLQRIEGLSLTITRQFVRIYVFSERKSINIMDTNFDSKNFFKLNSIL